MTTQGLLIGDFSVLHLGHLTDIHQAAGMVDRLHIIVLHNDSFNNISINNNARPLSDHSSSDNPSSSNPPSHSPTTHIIRAPTLQDKVRWLQNACQHFSFVTIHTLSSLKLDISFDFDYTRQAFDPNHSLNTAHIDAICQALQIDNCVLFTKQAYVQESFVGNYNAAVLPTTTQDDLNIAQYPLRYFHHLALPCRYFFALKVCLVGGESSGKTTLVHKLANDYAASVALEMGRLYTHSHLGGTELGLQYSDYPTIAAHHAHAIEIAATHASSPVVLIDTDFVTTQAFCAAYEHRPHPMLDAWITQYHPNSTNPYRIDCTIYLDNNVAWVADGMRRLGGSQRSHFAQTLLDLYAKHDIALHHIDSPNYHERYLTAKAIIDAYLN